MNKQLFKVIVLMLFGKLCYMPIHAQESTMLDQSSKHCANCHGGKYYSFLNTLTEQTERKKMNPYFIIDTIKYKEGVHSGFSCEDCHSYEYVNYPHAAELKLEPKFSCLDCHGGDETFAKYQFDAIDVEVENSVHKNAFGAQFSCEHCHDQHLYKPIARNDKSMIKEIVIANNEMCLSCHNNLLKYEGLTDNAKPKILSTHSWLPNQKLHFMSVRCIECHTPVTDTLMVSHKILPKEQAVRLCSDCHSTNSILRDKLYKYSNQKSRKERGFYNSVFLNESYVIGANRNRIVNTISVILMGLTFLVILIHVVFRIVKRK